MTETEENEQPAELLGFAHRFIPLEADTTGRRRTVLLLHGTGGNENDLIPMARELAPGSALLSVRGKVMEAGMPRFFRRFAEGIFDLEDLKFRTNELADFVISASKQYDFDPNSVVALGYSNGANIAASMLLLRSNVLSGAVLFRAMVPFVPEKLPDLSGKSIFISAGKYDPIVPREQVEQLRKLFENCGAFTTLNWTASNHSLNQEDMNKARNFLQTLVT